MCPPFQIPSTHLLGPNHDGSVEDICTRWVLLSVGLVKSNALTFGLCLKRDSSIWTTMPAPPQHCWSLQEFCQAHFTKPPINGNCCFMSHFSLFLGIFDGVLSNPQVHQTASISAVAAEIFQRSFLISSLCMCGTGDRIL